MSIDLMRGCMARGESRRAVVQAGISHGAIRACRRSAQEPAPPHRTQGSGRAQPARPAAAGQPGDGRPPSSLESAARWEPRPCAWSPRRSEARRRRALARAGKRWRRRGLRWRWRPWGPAPAPGPAPRHAPPAGRTAASPPGSAPPPPRAPAWRQRPGRPLQEAAGAHVRRGWQASVARLPGKSAMRKAWAASLVYKPGARC